VLALDVGGMYAFYLTPLYAAAHRHPVLDAVLQVHMFLAGCLLSWYLVGSDPMPSRPSVRTRLLVLLLAAGSHDLLAKLLYAQGLPRHGGTEQQLQAGAQIMFYGGDLVEVALAVALLSNWYSRTGRRLARATVASSGQIPSGSPGATSPTQGRHQDENQDDRPDQADDDRSEASQAVREEEEHQPMVPGPGIGTSWPAPKGMLNKSAPTAAHPLGAPRRPGRPHIAPLCTTFPDLRCTPPGTSSPRRHLFNMP
jgi:hypothetical protein